MSILVKIKQLPWLRRIVHRSSFRHVHRGMEKIYCRYVRWLSHRGNYKLDKAPEEVYMCVVITAFNAPHLIEKQLQCLQHHVKDESCHILVGDNSTQASARGAIAVMCEKYHAEYVAVPRWMNRWLLNTLFLPSYSHGAALNWLWHKVLINRPYAAYTFIDHDLMPLHSIHLSDMLGNYPFHGVQRERDEAWYLWPGLALFKAETLKNINADFLPAFVGKTYLDTGGELYHRLYKHNKSEKPTPPEIRTVRIRKVKDGNRRRDVYHADCIQYIGDHWIHLINVTNYAHTEDKTAMVEQILACL